MYHPGRRSRELLHEYRVNPDAVLPPEPGPFTRAVQARVAEYFTERGLDPKASWGQCFWYFFATILFLACLYGYLTGSWPALVGLALSSWFVFGMGHDGAHFAVSRKPWLNRMTSLGLLTNMNVMVWYYHHTLGHHVNTNKIDDPDLHISYPFIRTSWDRKRRRWHRWQAVLLPIYFLLPTGLMLLVGPPIWLLRRRAIGVTPMNYPRQLLWGGISWFISVGVLVIIPAVQFPIWQAILFPLTYLMISGLIFSLNVFASHLSSECSLRPTGGLDWACAQVKGTLNWRSGSWLASWLSVGVNHQIEHHLFPGINPEHYHRISWIVQSVCKEFDVEYRSHATFVSFVAGSVKWVHALSRNSHVSAPIM